MHGADIQAAIRKAGLTQLAIARRMQVTQQCVNRVVWDKPKGRSLRVAKAISRATGLSIETLWPGVYTGRTQPKKGSK
jgi:lambda repressor-like predicted transcriptional regulator